MKTAVVLLATGLPDKGGYFEIRLPKPLLEGQPRGLELQ